MAREFLCRVVFLMLAIAVSGQTVTNQTSSTTTPPPLKEVAPGVFQIGLVQLDKTRKSVQFPAVLNMDHGLIEYLLVTTRGKTHESLLKTDAQPYHVHVAMLLLGAKGAAQSKELLKVPVTQQHVNTPGATNRLAELLKGDPVRIELTWTNFGKVSGTASSPRPSPPEEEREKNTGSSPRVMNVPAEDCINNLQTGKTAVRTNWNYNGSRVVDGIFMAQQEGSIVAVIDDVDAMVNNPRPDHDNDQIWQVRTNFVPKVGEKVLVTIRLEGK
jgi:hypothetical protein